MLRVLGRLGWSVVGTRGIAVKKQKELKERFHFPSHKPYLTDDYYAVAKKSRKIKYRKEQRFGKEKLLKETEEHGVTMQTLKRIMNAAPDLRGKLESQQSRLEEQVHRYMATTKDPARIIETSQEYIKRRALGKEFQFTENFKRE